MAFCYFNCCQGDAQIWLSVRPRPWCYRTWKASLVELLDNKEGFGLGYDTSNDELFQASRVKKRKWIGQRMSIPHIKVTFSALTEVIKFEVAQGSCEKELDLACLICLCLKEFLVNAIISPRDDLTFTIRPCDPSETVGH